MTQSAIKPEKRELISRNYLLAWLLMATCVGTVSGTVFFKKPALENMASSNSGDNQPIQLPSVQTTASIVSQNPSNRLAADEQGLSIIPQRKVETERISLPPLEEKFALDLGGGNSFNELEARFEQIAQLNPSLFRKLEPRGHFLETSHGLTVRLRVGPFISKAGAKKACSFVILPENVTCHAAVFEGNSLSTQMQ